MFGNENLSKDDIPLVQTRNHNSSSLSKSEETIQELTQRFTQLHKDSNDLVPEKKGLGSLFRSKEEKLQEQQNIAKMRAYHDYEMSIGSAICEAKKKDIQMQIATGLAQKKVVLDAQTKARIGEIYSQFGEQMNDRIKDAVRLYLDGIKQAEAIPDSPAKEKLIEYTKRKFDQDQQLIEDLGKEVLRNIYTDLQANQ